MIEIADAPDIAACAGCMSPLVWLYSYRTGRTFSAVATGPASFETHQCRTGQDPRTWRDTYRGDPPSGEYVQVKERIASRRGP